MTVHARHEGAPGRARAPRARSARGAQVTARSVALDALYRIEHEGGYANLVLAAALAASPLDGRDRALATELVYGTTRMRRACDWLLDRFVLGDLEPRVRSALRMGAYQIAFLRIPPHAAVSATVDVVPKRARGLANAVLRRVADHPVDDRTAPELGGWPDLATRLSYPDWVVERLVAQLGPDVAEAMMRAMNEPAQVHSRADGYVQDLASQAVVAVVAAQPGDRVLDLCAAPGGKATAMASSGAHVLAGDNRASRTGLIVENVARLGVEEHLSVFVADATGPPVRDGSIDRVLVDAPCSGLGSLRRRADARWRIEADDIPRLADLQRRIVESALPTIRPGGRLVYSVCTVLDDETRALDDWMRRTHPEVVAEPLGGDWAPFGRGGRLLPTAQGSDGMTCYSYRMPR